MAKATYNATLEYAPNVLEFWLVDDNGAPSTTPFDTDTTFSIGRVDGQSVPGYSVTGVVDSSHITFTINPTEADLYLPGDTVYDYEQTTFEHSYSVKSSSQVYLTGLVNMVRVP